MAFKMDDYVDVAARKREFRAKHPDGSLQPVNLNEPFTVVEIGGATFIAYAAAAYRNPDDPRPGIGLAWEPFPGKTPYTKDSELQNAETSAWGRAIEAALVADSKKIASAEEVRNRTADREAPPRKSEPAPFVSAENAQTLRDRCESLGVDLAEVVRLGTSGRTELPEEVRTNEIKAVKEALDNLTPAVDELPTYAGTDLEK